MKLFTVLHSSHTINEHLSSEGAATVKRSSEALEFRRPSQWELVGLCKLEILKVSSGIFGWIVDGAHLLTSYVVFFLYLSALFQTLEYIKRGQILGE